MTTPGYRLAPPASAAVEPESAGEAVDPAARASFPAGAAPAVYHPGQAKATPVLGHPLEQTLPATAEEPAYGESVGKRSYSVEQYKRMWEEEQGHGLTTFQHWIIRKGCVGLVGANLATFRDPISLAEVFGTFEQAHAYMEQQNRELVAARSTFWGSLFAPSGQFVMFGKKFWSNQKSKDNYEPDAQAFRPDPKTGRVDMSALDETHTRAMVGRGNFDYGFWDEASQSFWHANHFETFDPADPMKVIQSSKERFTRLDHTSYDRCVFGVALASGYDPEKAVVHQSEG